MEKLGYLVLRGGSGRCAAASRSREDPHVSAALAEAGNASASTIMPTKKPSA